MKKVILCAAAFGLAANLFALRPGDPVVELTDVNWVQAGPFAMLPPAKPQENEPPYRATVFLLTRAQTADDTLTLLNYLRRTFAGKVRLAAVTPDSETDVKALLARRPDFELPFGVDTKRELTPKYLGSSRILPMAFLADDKGEVIWSGEVVDLGETLRKCLDGSFDRSAQRKIAPLLEELQSQLSGDNETRMRRTVDSIFRLEPGQPSALRIRCFVLESGGKAVEALELIQSQIARAPKLPRLYIEALNLIARNPGLDARTAPVVAAYCKAVAADPDSDNQIAWLLLNRREDSADALRSALFLVNRAAPLVKPDASGALRGAFLNTRALLGCRLGKMAEAARLEDEAAEAFRSAGLPGAETEAKRRAAYYRTVLELAGAK